VLLGDSDIDAQEYPLNYIALLLQPPGILAGRPPTTDLEGHIWAAYNTEEMKQYIDDNEGMLMGPINPNTFARMLAKIAYAYTVGHKGYGTFKPMVLDLILGRTETANYWVGGDLELPPTSNDPVLHDVRGRRCTVDDKTYFIVTIQLFAFLRSPIYHVVVAEVDGPGQKVTVIQKHIHTIQIEIAMPSGEINPFDIFAPIGREPLHCLI
jgi:hypothetical protein